MKQQRRSRKHPQEVELVLALLGNGVFPSQISVSAQLFRQFYMAANPGVELRPAPSIAHRLVCKYRQFLLPTVVQIVAGMQLASPNVKKLQLRSDQTSIRSQHYGATLTTGITEDNQAFSVLLEAYQMVDGKAESIAAGHASTFDRTRGLLEEILYHASDACPDIDPEKVRLSLLTVYFTDHASNEKSAGELIQEKMTSECQLRQEHENEGKEEDQPCPNCALSRQFCNNHKRTNLEDAGISVGEAAFFHHTSSATLHTLRLDGCPSSPAAREKYIAGLLTKIEAKLDLNDLVRSIYQLFAYGIQPYEHGSGLTFRQWVKQHHPSKVPLLALLRIVGNRNDVYLENSLLIYSMYFVYLEFLVQERQVRWGKKEKKELNGLQEHVIDSLTFLPLRAALRGRAQWFYVVFDPLRFLSSVATLSEMANHWAVVGMFLTRVMESGGTLMCTRQVETLFDYEPKVADWRKRKMESSSSYKTTVDELYREDECDGMMPMYHTNFALGMVEKYKAMTFDQEQWYNLDPEAQDNTRGLLTNDAAEQVMGHLKHVCSMSTSISPVGASAMAAARFNGLFKYPHGQWWKLTPDQRASVIDLAYKRWDETAVRAAQTSMKHLQQVMKKRQEQRVKQAQREEAKATKLAGLANVVRVRSVKILDKVVARIRKGKKPATKLKDFLTKQLRIRREVDQRKDLPKLSIPDPNSKTGKRQRNAEELLVVTRSLIAAEQNSQLPPDEELAVKTLLEGDQLLKLEDFIPQVGMSLRVRASLEEERLKVFHNILNRERAKS
jgi:hypothetical protein